MLVLAIQTQPTQVPEPMQKWKLSFLITIIVLFVILFSSKFERSQKHHANNTVTVQHIVEKKTPKQKIAKKIKPKAQTPKAYNPLTGYDKNIDKTPEADYVTAFREFKKFKRCRRIIESLENNQDPYQDFIKSKSKHRPFELNTIQRQQFEVYVDVCNSMLSHDGELYTAAAERYRKRFYQTEPKTQEAKDLAQSWPLKVETEHIGFKYTAFINGYDAGDYKLVRKVKKQLRRYKGMLRYINRNTDITFSVRTHNEINMYENQIAELNNIVDGITNTDDEYLIDLYQAYAENLGEVHKFLAQNQSGDAFMTLAPIIFSRRNIELGFYDSQYFKKLIKPASLLYACSLGLPCDAGSIAMIYECLYSGSGNERACGTTVEDYYLDYHFSPNQLLDIDHIISYFITNYAKT
ncbi:hypothetical protein MNBD_GAMMA03-2068 [hydrothermal vent metagenome]|uniref:Uncharacterized protein n=1 Tax=hydrothermal vent metagenome TaxID=652676 RepID=A0A3B0W1R4_9ZZZZ